MMKSTTYLLIGLSILLCTSYANAFTNYKKPSSSSQIQRVRINVTTPMGYTRHLLLGFTPDNSATDGFDYGYDAANVDNYNNDCNWLIENGRYVVQGVGEFVHTKAYPLGLFLTDVGNVEFSLQALENFDQNISVYIYDSFNDEMHQINNTSYVESLMNGNHVNRFYITFTNDSTLINFANNQLSIGNEALEDLQIRYLEGSNQLQLKLNNNFNIKSLVIYDTLGKIVIRQQNLKSDNSGVHLISATHLTTGIYIIGLSSDTGNLKKCIVISK